jgi:hypothetical protein
MPHTVTPLHYYYLTVRVYCTACERPLARVCPDNGQYTVQDDMTMLQQRGGGRRGGMRALPAQRSLANVRAHVPSGVFEAGSQHDRVARGEPDGN